MVKDMGHKFMLINYDWAASLGEVKYPRHVNKAPALQQPDDVEDGQLILTEHDVSMLENMFPQLCMLSICKTLEGLGILMSFRLNYLEQHLSEAFRNKFTHLDDLDATTSVWYNDSIDKNSLSNCWTRAALGTIIYIHAG